MKNSACFTYIRALRGKDEGDYMKHKNMLSHDCEMSTLVASHVDNVLKNNFKSEQTAFYRQTALRVKECLIISKR